MCGRFLLEASWDDILEAYNLQGLRRERIPVGEMFPGTRIPVVVEQEKSVLELGRWGYKMINTGKELINARLEGIESKPAFKKSFYERRCLIPANAFYEWRTQGKEKVKYRIKVEGRNLFSMAGIYNIFQDADQKPYIGFAVLTMEANANMKQLHHRMPVILDQSMESLWLSGEVKSQAKAFESLSGSESTSFIIIPDNGIEQMSLLDV